MSDIHFDLPGPGTALFFAAAVGIYAAVSARDTPVLSWGLTSVTLLFVSSGLAVEHAHLTVKSQKPYTLRTLWYLMIVTMLGVILTAFMAVISLTR